MQETPANAESRALLEKMIREVKQMMKPKSKNELIRIISAMAVDNFTLKVQLAELQPKDVKVEDKNEI